MRRLFLAAPMLAALVVGAAVAPAGADAYNDTTLGMYVETPDSFTIRLGVKEGYDLVLHIHPVGDYPGRVEGESGGLCTINFKAVRSGGTQQAHNSRMKDEAAVAQTRRQFERVMQVKSETTFTLRDAKGAEVVGVEFAGPSRDVPAAFVMTSLVATPRGQLQMNCVLRADQAPKALYSVRPIRDSIKPP